jgi:hypothetical protein
VPAAIRLGRETARHGRRQAGLPGALTRKARNAELRGWASMIVQGRASTGRSLMVAGEGTARVLRGPEAHDRNHRLRAKYIKPGALDA